MNTPTRSTSAKVRPISASTACMSSMHVRVSTSMSPSGGGSGRSAAICPARNTWSPSTTAWE